MPPGAVCGPVTVAVGGQTSNARVVTVLGTSCGVQLVDLWGGGLPGDVVVLEGAGFNVVTPANNVVKFTAAGGGTVTAVVLAAGGTQLHVRIPDTAVQVQRDPGVIKSEASRPTRSSIRNRIRSRHRLSTLSSTAQPRLVRIKSRLVLIQRWFNLVRAMNVKKVGYRGLASQLRRRPSTSTTLAGTVTLNSFQSGEFSRRNLHRCQFDIYTGIHRNKQPCAISGVALTDTSGGDLPSSGIFLSSSSVTVLRVP